MRENYQHHLWPLSVRRDWYVAIELFNPLELAHEEHDKLQDRTKPKLRYIFGGTLKQVKDYIRYSDRSIRSRLTWVPSEFVEEHLFDNITYPT